MLHNDILINQNLNIMKQILIDDASNAYSFDDENVVPLGKAVSFKGLWQDKIFAIGKDIYLKKGDTYSILTTDAQFFAFGAPDPYAEKQFEVIDGTVLYVEQGTPGIIRFPNLEAYAPLYAAEIENFSAKAFAICSNKQVTVYVQDSELDVLNSGEEALSYEKALLWNGHGYLLEDGKFVRRPWNLMYITDAYVLLRLGKVLFAFYADGKTEVLGVEEKRVATKAGELLVVKKDGVLYCYYLGRDILQQVLSIYGEDDTYHISSEGNIEHHYVYSVEYEDFNACDRYELRGGKYERVNS